MRARSAVFFGWWVTAAFCVMVFISAGVRHAVGPFLKPMVADLGLDRATFSLVIAVSLFLYGVFMPLVGRLVDVMGARTVTVVGCVLMAGSLAATGLVRNAWELAIVYGLLAPIGLAATSPVVAAGVVSRWFAQRRGTALSVLGSASMTGMSLLVPALTWLILTTGWRTTYLLIGAGVLVLILPLALFVVKDSPESMGLGVDGARVTATPTTPERTSVGDAVGTLAFWQLAGTFLTCGFSMSLISAHGVPMLTDHGYTPMFASWTFGVLGAASIGFTLWLGTMADRYGRRPVLSLVYAGRLLTFAGFFLIRDAPIAIMAVAVFGGLTLAGTVSMTSALTADIYGRYSVGTIFGVIYLSHQTGSAVGTWLAGLLFETTGGYGAAFTVACLFLLVASIVSWRIDDGSRRVFRLAPARS
jgi:MFS family permease